MKVQEETKEELPADNSAVVAECAMMEESTKNMLKKLERDQKRTE